VLQAARSTQLHLLYVSPERFASPAFMQLLADLAIARFVIDEAHCVSEWGHDFRPDYRRLRAAARGCCRSDGGAGRPPMAAFTATATPEVRDDVIALLGLRSPHVLVAGFDRPNLFLRVEAIGNETEKHLRIPALVGGRRALVYAATRRMTEEAAGTLQSARIPASAYHAGLKDDERTRVQEAFADGSLRVVCATNAFGMGIDRPDVDAVIHFAIPGSVEAYYQEIGRAGRDGRAATATLLYHRDDIATRRFLIDSPKRDKRRHVPVDVADAGRRRALEHKKLDRMVAYAETSGCLRATILRYFGDIAAAEPCAGCCNCLPHGRLDAYEATIVRKILDAIAGCGERYGRRRIAAMLTGDLTDLPPSLARLASAGALQYEDAATVERWIGAIVASGLAVRSQDEYRTLRLTPRGRDVMIGNVDVGCVTPPSAGGLQHSSWPGAHYDLRSARRRLERHLHRDERWRDPTG
jgi:ATP-dependent DNA helicase RecQ